MKRKFKYPKPPVLKDKDLCALNNEQVDLHMSNIISYLNSECGVSDELIEQFFKTAVVIVVNESKEVELIKTKQ